MLRGFRCQSGRHVEAARRSAKERWAASLRMFGDTNQRHRHECTLVVVATACWQQRKLCARAHAVEYTFARESPGASAFLAKHSRETAASDSAPRTHGSGSLELHTM